MISFPDDVLFCSVPCAKTRGLNSNWHTNQCCDKRRRQERTLSKSKKAAAEHGRKRRLVITEHNVGLGLTLQGVMDGASPLCDARAASRQCLWATESYEVINHATRAHW